MSAGDPCACGAYDYEDGYSRAAHKKAHREWEYGLLLPKSAPPDQSVLIVPGNARLPLRWLAYRMARIARRDGHYDFASFDYPLGGYNEDWMKYRTHAFLAVQDAHAVAYAVVRLRPRQLLIYQHGEEITFAKYPVPYEVITTARPCVDLIFTTGAYRRQGLMRQLTTAITAHYHLEHPCDLLWGAPFSEMGLPTILALTKGTVWAG